MACTVLLAFKTEGTGWLASAQVDDNCRSGAVAARGASASGVWSGRDRHGVAWSERNSAWSIQEGKLGTLLDGQHSHGRALACVRGNMGALTVGRASVAAASCGDLVQAPSA
jgi:hypothetical protein